jgi:hypothetical protein
MPRGRGSLLAECDRSALDSFVPAHLGELRLQYPTVPYSTLQYPIVPYSTQQYPTVPLAHLGELRLGGGADRRRPSAGIASLSQSRCSGEPSPGADDVAVHADVAGVSPSPVGDVAMVTAGSFGAAGNAVHAPNSPMQLAHHSLLKLSATCNGAAQPCPIAHCDVATSYSGKRPRQTAPNC